jgi:type IV pilus assembly protein PilM
MFSKQYLAIDMGSNKIKLVRGGIDKGNIVVSEYAIIDTPENSLEDGKIINLDKLVTLIKESVKKNKMKDRNLVLNVTGTGIITRDIQIPKSNDEEIEKILEFEAQQYFPVVLDNYVLDYKVQEEIDNQEGILNRVLLVAVPLNQIDEYMKIHKRLGMEISAIDIPANNMFKLLFSWEDGGFKEEFKMPREFAVLDIGYLTTAIYIFSSEKLKFNRILLNGSSYIDEIISNYLNTDLKTAEEIKNNNIRIDNVDNFESDTDKFSQVNNQIKSGLNNFMNDINRFFEFYNSRGSGNMLEKIFICGGGSKLKGINEYLNDYFNMPVESLYNQVKNVVYKGVKDQKEFESDFPLLVNAIGGLIRSK